MGYLYYCTNLCSFPIHLNPPPGDSHTVDVKAAYLQGDDIKREVYLRPPKEFDTGQIWKLKKTIYGLCDAARAWYIRVKDELIKLGVEKCPLDN